MQCIPGYVLNLRAVLIERIRLALTAPLTVARRWAHVSGLNNNGVERTGVRRRVGVSRSRDGKAATADVAGTKTGLRAEGQLRHGDSKTVRSLATS